MTTNDAKDNNSRSKTLIDLSVAGALKPDASEKDIAQAHLLVAAEMLKSLEAIDWKLWEIYSKFFSGKD